MKILKEASHSGATGTSLAKGSLKTVHATTTTTTTTTTTPTGISIKSSPKSSPKSSQSLKDSSSVAKEGDAEPYDFFKYKGDNAKYGTAHTTKTENVKSIPKAGEATQRKKGATNITIGDKMPRLKNLVNEFLNKNTK